MRVATASRAAVILSLCSLGASTARAQVWGTVDVGGATVRYDDTIRVTARTLTPRIRFDDGALAGSAVGTISSLTEGGWTAQGSLDLSVLSSAAGPARLELAGEIGGSLHGDATRTGQYLGRARLHVGGGRMGAWVGAAAGRTWDASLWHRVLHGDFGAWMRAGALEAVAMVTPASVGDSLRYTDTQGALRWQTHRADLTLGVGARAGDALARRSPTMWGSASATLWLSPHVGLVASGGTYPVDFMQGYPGGRYLSLTIRLGERPTTVLLRTATPAAGLRMRVSSAPDARRTIRVYAPAARSVELMGDFTAWQPVALGHGTDGWWIMTLPIAPGRYQLNVRVNGGAWDVPSGALEAVDEFGARVGVIDIR